MKCPLIKKRAELEEGYEYDEPLDCLKEECAWWDKGLDCCHLVSLGCSAKAIGDVLSDIHDKMPPGRE